MEGTEETSLEAVAILDKCHLSVVTNSKIYKCSLFSSMMKPLYIFDLEGTLGIFSEGLPHVNNTAQLRPGFENLIRRVNSGELRMAIATRAPRHFVQDILLNLERRGLKPNCPVYTKEDIEVENTINFKDLSKLYRENRITSPYSQAVMIGDFLRLPDAYAYSMQDYLDFDFVRHPDALSQNYSLNDHPFPLRKTPVYAVLPQPWTTMQNGKRTTLSLDYIMPALEQMFKRKFRHANIPGTQKLTSPLMSHALGKNFPQRYLIMKGHPDNWQPMSTIF